MSLPKIIISMLLTMLLSMSICSASNELGIVIVADDDSFKTEEYQKICKKISSDAVILEDEVSNTEEAMVEFATNSTYNKVLFLVIDDIRYKEWTDEGFEFNPGMKYNKERTTHTDMIRAYIDMTAYMYNNDSLKNKIEVSGTHSIAKRIFKAKFGLSRGSQFIDGKPYAVKGAFEKCIKDVRKTLQKDNQHK